MMKVLLVNDRDFVRNGCCYVELKEARDSS